MRSVLKRLLYLIPIYDPEVKNWALEARMLRWLTFLWLSIGLISLFSASYPVGNYQHQDGLYYLKRQLLWSFLGLWGFNWLVKMRLRPILRISPWGLLFFLGLILITLTELGETRGGATRWLAIGPLLLQPSDLIKPFLVLQSARIFGQWRQLSGKSRLTWLIIFAVILGCILKQPNLSTTALCGMGLWLIALAAGLSLGYLGLTAIAGVGVAMLSLTLNPYQWERVISFMDPWQDPTGKGYQLLQSLLAVGSGGPWGMGFGLSQQKLFYLPIQYTDFIFAVFAEEFGFIGGLLLLLLLVGYASLGLLVALKCKHRVSRLIAMGVVIFLVGQSLLNIAVAIGALPTTGLPLPFFSYGGSSLLSSLFLAALLIRVARENNQAQVVSLIPKEVVFGNKSLRTKSPRGKNFP